MLKLFGLNSYNPSRVPMVKEMQLTKYMGENKINETIHKGWEVDLVNKFKIKHLVSW
jgi:hypothetical protein